MFNNLTNLFKPTFIYFLSLQKCSRNSNWTTHGLWIDNYPEGTGFPEYCKKVDFNVTLLDPIIDQLTQTYYKYN